MLQKFSLFMDKSTETNSTTPNGGGHKLKLNVFISCGAGMRSSKLTSSDIVELIDLFCLSKLYQCFIGLLALCYAAAVVPTLHLMLTHSQG